MSCIQAHGHVICVRIAFKSEKTPMNRQIFKENGSFGLHIKQKRKEITSLRFPGNQPLTNFGY